MIDGGEVGRVDDDGAVHAVADVVQHGGVPQWYIQMPAYVALNWYTSDSPGLIVRISHFRGDFRGVEVERVLRSCRR